jgi:hypothetical protein
MEKEFVTYEIASELKELGFDEPCLEAYDKNGMLYHSHKTDKLFTTLNSNLSTQCSAPLYQQVFGWFEDNYSELFYEYYVYHNDYFQKYESTLEFMSAKNLNLNHTEVQLWLHNNVSHKTFFHMISHSYAKSSYVATDNLLKDTFNQLSKMLNEGCEIEKPKRWRIAEFHDHISFLFLKRDLKIVKHETTYIPVPQEQERWKVYQPKDTLELALWGKKVGNCVLSYEEKIMGKESVIVLIEEDSAPKYTIELDANMANFHIKQAVSHGNKTLTTEETQLCTQLIKTAIQK